MPDPVNRPDSDDFRERLAAAKQKAAPKPRDVAVTALARGTRHAFEIAATTLVGAGLGWWLDRWLGTKPWGFLLLLLLGVVAGFWNLLKAVNAETAALAARKRDELPVATPADDANGVDGPDRPAPKGD